MAPFSGQEGGLPLQQERLQTKHLETKYITSSCSNHYMLETLAWILWSDHHTTVRGSLHGIGSCITDYIKEAVFELISLESHTDDMTYRSSQNYYRHSCYSWEFIFPKLPLPLPSWNSDEFPLPLPSWRPQSPLHFQLFPITVLKVIWINFPKITVTVTVLKCFWIGKVIISNMTVNCCRIIYANAICAGGGVAGAGSMSAGMGERGGPNIFHLEPKFSPRKLSRSIPCMRWTGLPDRSNDQVGKQVQRKVHNCPCRRFRGNCWTVIGHSFEMF